MKPIKVIKDGKYKDKYVFNGDIIEPSKDNIEMIDALNYAGFIEPLSIKDLIQIKKEINDFKKYKMKEE